MSRSLGHVGQPHHIPHLIVQISLPPAAAGGAVGGEYDLGIGQCGLELGHLLVGHVMSGPPQALQPGHLHQRLRGAEGKTQIQILQGCAVDQGRIVRHRGHENFQIAQALQILHGGQILHTGIGQDQIFQLGHGAQEFAVGDLHMAQVDDLQLGAVFQLLQLIAPDFRVEQHRSENGDITADTQVIRQLHLPDEENRFVPGVQLGHLLVRQAAAQHQNLFQSGQVGNGGLQFLRRVDADAGQIQLGGMDIQRPVQIVHLPVKFDVRIPGGKIPQLVGIGQCAGKGHPGQTGQIGKGVQHFRNIPIRDGQLRGVVVHPLSVQGYPVADVQIRPQEKQLLNLRKIGAPFRVDDSQPGEIIQRQDIRRKQGGYGQLFRVHGQQTALEGDIPDNLAPGQNAAELFVFLAGNAAIAQIQQLQFFQPGKLCQIPGQIAGNAQLGGIPAVTDISDGNIGAALIIHNSGTAGQKTYEQQQGDDFGELTHGRTVLSINIGILCKKTRGKSRQKTLRPDIPAGVNGQPVR